MLCEKCKKNQAVLYVKQSINGDIKEYHLCSQCVYELNNSSFSFHNMFQDLFEFSSVENKNTKNIEIEKCPNCGMTFNELAKNSKLGCGVCFETFGERIKYSLKNIQGSVQHKGKIPKKYGGKISAKREVEILKRKLAVAIEKEEFEEAARLRDEIKKI